MEKLIEDTAARIFMEQTEDANKLWAALEESGFTRAWVPESLDGFGLPLEDGFELIRMSAKALTAVPFAETLLANYFLATVDQHLSGAKFTLCTTTDSLDNIPFADSADYLLRLERGTIEVWRFNLVDQVNELSGNSAGQIILEGESPVIAAAAPDWLSSNVYEQMGALVRSAQLCGAMEHILSITLQYTSARQQFGRSLAKFQAIQLILTRIAAQTASSCAALQFAVMTPQLSQAPDWIAIACAKAKASAAAGLVVTDAIQAHGAIGYTQEYMLSNYIHRIWRWREDFGGETYWQIKIGQHYTQPDSGSLIEDIFGQTNTKC
ncbi:MAG: acyl-CoA dehydrogenase [Porticoccaceae bacterium]|nr:acyl-CoA dehydrogenase [Porticoccaceae bacterium]